MALDSAVTWIDSLRFDAIELKLLRDAAVLNIQEREESLDIEFSSLLSGDSNSYFWTPNHPNNNLLIHQARQIINELLEGADDLISTESELLGHIRMPEVDLTTGALKTRSWQIHGNTYSDHEVLQRHLEFYANNPAILRHAYHEHEERINMRIGV